MNQLWNEEEIKRGKNERTVGKCCLISLLTDCETSSAFVLSSAKWDEDNAILR